MSMMKEYRYSDEVTEKMNELSGAVADLDSDLCNDLVAEISGMI